ncbi:MAG: MBL fold metallo-hydrolase [Aulosira sp. ZfuVER01]
MLANKGLTTPPCGVPCSGYRDSSHNESHSTPKCNFRHVRLLATPCVRTFHSPSENAQTVPSDRYIADGEILQLGSVQIQAIATPGHTDSHMAYLVNGTHLLTGDALFIGGCGRTDFQNGDPGLLYDVVTQKLFTLPDDTWVFPGHDYQGRTVSTIGEQKSSNLRFVGRNRSQFIELMNNLNLPYPKKMSEAVPANQRGGKVLVTLDYQI